MSAPHAEDPVLCRSCRAPIRWAPTRATGAPMPLDATPTSAGNVTLEANLLGELEAVVHPNAALGTLRRAGVELFMPHHATCPHGKAWHR